MRDAAPGIDDVTWQVYGETIDDKLKNLRERIHKAARGRRLDDKSRMSGTRSSAIATDYSLITRWHAGTATESREVVDPA